MHTLCNAFPMRVPLEHFSTLSGPKGEAHLYRSNDTVLIIIDTEGNHSEDNVSRELFDASRDDIEDMILNRLR